MTGVLFNADRCKTYFNSHPHEEDDLSGNNLAALPYISTHILTKRMTGSMWPLQVLRCISTHILTKRMTAGSMDILAPSVDFNSHPHEEDDNGRTIICTAQHISTHILTKRMTFRSSNYIFHISHFNSHPHEEDDLHQSEAILHLHHFNSHPHEEDDTRKCQAETIKYYFNSHPHEEDDLFYHVGLWFYFISTHILTKRMTRR